MKNNMFDWDKICKDADYCIKEHSLNNASEYAELSNEEKAKISETDYNYYAGFLHGVLYFRDNLKINLEKI